MAAHPSTTKKHSSYVRTMAHARIRCQRVSSARQISSQDIHFDPSTNEPVATKTLPWVLRPAVCLSYTRRAVLKPSARGTSYRNIIAGPVDLVECTRVHRPTEEGRRCQAKKWPQNPHKNYGHPAIELDPKSRLQGSHMCKEEKGQEPRARRRPEISESRTEREHGSRHRSHTHEYWEDAHSCGRGKTAAEAMKQWYQHLKTLKRQNTCKAKDA